MNENENEKNKNKEYMRIKHIRDKLIVLFYYKKTTELKCEHCGEKDILKLTLNHKFKDRRKDESTGSVWYEQLIKNKLPEKDRFNVLCNSCQLSFQHNRSIFIKDNERFKYLIDQYIDKIKNTNEDLDHVKDLMDTIEIKELNFNNDAKNGGENGEQK